MNDLLMDMNKEQNIYVGRKYELSKSIKNKRNNKSLLDYLKDDLFLESDQKKLDAYLKNDNKGNYVMKRVIEENNDIKGTYQLKEALSLFTELYKIKPFKERGTESLLAFSRVYGLPADDNEFSDQESIIIHDSIDWLTINLKLMEYRRVMNEFIKYRETNEDELKGSLVERLQSKIKHVECTIEEINKELVFNTVYEDLFQVAYYQITEALINEYELRKCDFCKNYFHPINSRMKYCPTLPLRKRSSCEMKHHNQLRNERSDSD